VVLGERRGIVHTAAEVTVSVSLSLQIDMHQHSEVLVFAAHGGEGLDG
jgi:hypothetical protein